MIITLHGAIGSPQDWDHMHFPGHIVKSLNLWRLLECCPKSLHQAGQAINGEATDRSNHLIGYSMGGRLALHALINSPDTWQKVVIISAHTGLLTEQDRIQRRNTDTEWASKALNLPWSTFLEQWNQQSVLGGCTLPDRGALKTWRPQVARSFIDWSTGAQEPLLPLLESVNNSVLWITGSEDSKFDLIAQQACQALPNGEHVSVPNCGHRVPWEQAETCQQIINDFLAQ